MLSSMSVGLAAALLASGALGDAIGRRRAYAAGLLLLGVGSLGCAVAPSTTVFVGARVLEGIGGAAVLACGLALLAHAFSAPADRAHATGVWGASVGLGITAGALLAAGLDVGTGWRETYVVVGLVALALVLPSGRWLPDSRAEHPRRLDVAGLVLLALALTLLVSALTESRSGLHPTTVLLFAASLVSLAAYAVVESRVAEPMLDLALLRTPGFVAATFGALVLGAGVIAMTSHVPTLVQVGLHGSLWTATWLITAWSAASVLTSLLVRRVRTRMSGPTLIASALVVVGAGQLLALGLGPTSNPWQLLPAMVVAGLATGVLNAVLGREAVASVPGDRAAMGSGSNNTARYLGAACGITVFSVLLSHAGTGAGAAGLVDGWSVAVLVAGLASLAGAAVIGVIAAYTTTPAQMDRGVMEKA
ncbi:MFS transporter [Marmoricola sp. URHB0036]|uniref:MFS transporter n=1 Tax=Marmoricola sp. URHB0036 TaxID=1298863 RepID=UPI00350EFDDB